MKMRGSVLLVAWLSLMAGGNASVAVADDSANAAPAAGHFQVRDYKQEWMDAEDFGVPEDKRVAEERRIRELKRERAAREAELLRLGEEHLNAAQRAELARIRAERAEEELRAAPGGGSFPNR